MLSLCLCGCGKEVAYECNKYINGHNRSGLKFTGNKFSDDHKNKISNSLTGRLLSTETKLKISNSLTGRKTSTGMLGKHQSEESKLKSSISNIGKNTGKKHLSETKIKISNALIGKDCWCKGKKLSNETKLKMSLSRKRYIEENGVSSVKEGKNEKLILNIIQNFTEIEFLRNNQNISRQINGKSIDGYSPKYNLSVEILESHHFKRNGELSDYDQNRELLIASRLGCMIYYISEQKFIYDTEKEIQRFKEFIDMVEIC